MVPTYRWQTPSITCRLGQSAAEHNHIIPQSNDYHETVPGTVWLRDVALQAGWFCGGTRGNEQRRLRPHGHGCADARRCPPPCDRLNAQLGLDREAWTKLVGCSMAAGPHDASLH